MKSLQNRVIIFGSFLLLLTLLSPLNLKSQSNYYKKEGATNIGAVIIDGDQKTNSAICKIKTGKKTTEYTPDQVSEYGFKDGRTYFSKDITIDGAVRKVFLERLAHGKSTFYYYEWDRGKTFFAEKDSTTIIELPEKHKGNNSAGFRNDLRLYTADCPQMADAIKLVKYNRQGYKKLLDRYTRCIERPFPFFKFGFIAGYSATKLVPRQSIAPPEIDQLDYNYDGSFTAGVFLDSPVLLSDISVALEFLFTHHEFSSSATIQYLGAHWYKEIDYYGRMTALQLPFLIRYALPIKKFRPYVNAGGIFSYNFNVEDHLYQATISQNVVEISDMAETNLIRPTMLGFLLGGGAAFQLLARNWIWLDLRYNGLYTLNSSQSMNMSEIQVTTRISF